MAVHKSVRFDKKQRNFLGENKPGQVNTHIYIYIFIIQLQSTKFMSLRCQLVKLCICADIIGDELLLNFGAKFQR